MTFWPDPLRPFEESLADSHAWLAAKGAADMSGALDRALAALDRRDIVALIEKYRSHGATGAFKYLDLPYWLARAAWSAKVLDLDQRRGQRVLDLGSGGCHFLAICRALGCRAIGLDARDPVRIARVPLPIYDDLATLFRARRVIQLIEPRRPLRGMNCRFQVVTAFLGCFHLMSEGYLREHPGRAEGKPWFSVAEWAYFLNDLVRNQLAFPAMVHLELNAHLPDGKGGFTHDSELMSWFSSQGGVIGRGGFRGAVTLELKDATRFG